MGLFANKNYYTFGITARTSVHDEIESLLILLKAFELLKCLMRAITLDVRYRNIKVWIANKIIAGRSYVSDPQFFT